jgi:hypothetical protein
MMQRQVRLPAYASYPQLSWYKLQAGTHSTQNRSPYDHGGKMLRRLLFSRLAALPLFALGAAKAQAPPKTLKVLMKSAWGPDDPTRAAFPFLHGLALAEAGHEVQIFLLAEATSLLRKSMVNAIMPVGWPPLSETLEKVVAKHIPVFS